MDIRGGTTNFVRVILKFDVAVLEERQVRRAQDCRNGSSYDNVLIYSQPSPYQMCIATVTGQAFLMHQVRCMMAILFLIGHSLEEESLISHMLDVQRCPCKPQYGMAPPEPLLLYDCHFDGLEWEQDQGEGKKVVIQFQELWTQLAAKQVTASFTTCQVLVFFSFENVCDLMARIYLSLLVATTKCGEPLLLLTKLAPPAFTYTVSLMATMKNLPAYY